MGKGKETKQDPRTRYKKKEKKKRGNIKSIDGNKEGDSEGGRKKGRSGTPGYAFSEAALFRSRELEPSSSIRFHAWINLTRSRVTAH